MNAHRQRVEELLERFEQLRQAPPGAYRWSHHHDGGQHSLHLVFGSMTHGDEVGSLPGLVTAIQQLTEGRISYGGKASFFIGNPEAGLQRKRFLEQDLNRMFMERDEEAHEVRRAQELMPILDTADMLMDFHQTILGTRKPFYICPWHRSGWLWARALGGARHWVTRAPHTSFASGLVCADEYVRVKGRTGLTLELGEQGFFEEAAERTLRTIQRALELGDRYATEPEALEAAAQAMPELSFLHTVHREPFSHAALTLREGLLNFEEVACGEVLSAPGSPEVKAPKDGAVLFPKYPPRNRAGDALDPRPSELYRIVQPLESHPIELWEADGQSPVDGRGRN